jgi:hypothetical protein
MDGAFYRDLREPFMIANQAAVTLAATNKALLPAAAHPALGAGYFARPGKKVHIRAFGVITTAATPGNGQFNIYWGSGADATGTIIGSTAAHALTASQTNIPWELDIVVTCRAVGSGTNGSLLVTGKAVYGEAVVAQRQMLPASGAPAAVGVDTTANNILSVQYLRSGSTAESMTLADFEFEPLN